MKLYQYYLVTLAILALDQGTKLLVHFNLQPGDLGEFVPIGLLPFFKIHYTTNPGMAFGGTFDWEYGKLALTLFRLLAAGGIAYYLYYLVKQRMHWGFPVALGLILGGALGNVIDSIFYGKYLGLMAPNAPFEWFHGEVIDMIYFDIWQGYLPGWIPFVGGEWYPLWPIFNIADASIFLGVAVILLFQNRFFRHQQGNSPEEQSPNQALHKAKDISVEAEYVRPSDAPDEAPSQHGNS